MPESSVKRVQVDIPCRDAQINRLVALFGETDHITVPSVFIYGHSATGKTAVVSSLMENIAVPHAIVNCVEFYSSKLLFEEILCQISGVHPCSENDYQTFEKCDNMNDFVHALRRAISYRGLENSTVYIVFDKAERLRDMDSCLLPSFLRLQELAQRNICVLLLSEIVWEKFRCGTGCSDPLIVHFPDYNKDPEFHHPIMAECIDVRQSIERLD